jgi:hypothetical protein
MLFSTSNMWGACWEVSRKLCAILQLCGEKGQGVFVGSVVGKSVFLLNLSRNVGTNWGPFGEGDQSVLNGTVLGPSVSVVGPSLLDRFGTIGFRCGTIIIGPFCDHRFPLWDHPDWTLCTPYGTICPVRR